MNHSFRDLAEENGKTVMDRNQEAWQSLTNLI